MRVLKTIFAILGVIFLIIIAFAVYEELNAQEGDTGASKTQTARVKLYKQLFEYQIAHSSQLAGQVRVEEFNSLYATDCPMFAPIIYYSLNPQIKFGGTYSRQGYDGYTFEYNEKGKRKLIRLGFYDSSVMKPDDPEKISPIYDIEYNKKPVQTNMTDAQITNKIVNDFCQPMNTLLDKYQDLPVDNIIGHLKKDIWNISSTQNASKQILVDKKKEIIELLHSFGCTEHLNKKIGGVHVYAEILLEALQKVRQQNPQGYITCYNPFFGNETSFTMKVPGQKKFGMRYVVDDNDLFANGVLYGDEVIPCEGPLMCNQIGEEVMRAIEFNIL